MIRLSSRVAQQKEEKHMKKWMALLLVCLLCLCAVEAMAEELGTLEVSLGRHESYDVYPNGYTRTCAGVTEFYPYQGAYVIQGKTDIDSPLDFHANAYDEATGKAKTQSGQNVSYDVTFDSLSLWPFAFRTPVRFGCNEGQATGCSITLKLRLSGTSYIWSFGHPSFQYSFSEDGNAVKICVHKSSGTLKLEADGSSEILVGKNITLYANGKTITNKSAENNSAMEIDAGQSSPTNLIRVESSPATYTADGIAAHWKCPGCGALFTDEEGLIETTLDALILPKLVRTDDLPQTGDTSRLAAWLALLGASCAGLWCLSRRRA